MNVATKYIFTKLYNIHSHIYWHASIKIHIINLKLLIIYMLKFWNTIFFLFKAFCVLIVKAPGGNNDQQSYWAIEHACSTTYPTGAIVACLCGCNQSLSVWIWDQLNEKEDLFTPVNSEKNHIACQWLWKGGSYWHFWISYCCYFVKWI